jgi:3'(2'), 5'-bisphosphate nucleotidase
MSDSELLECMIDAAVRAGRAAHAIYRRGFRVELKADASPVTEADRASEAVILEALTACAREIPIVAEEHSAEWGLPDAPRGEFFLVDPLDGTKEFIERRGDYTVNIALVRGGTPVLGVVYAPANGQLYAGDVGARRAIGGQQASESAPGVPGEPIRVRTPPARGLTAVASRSHRTPETDAYLAQYRVAELVSIGSSLKFCLVARGEADLYPRLAPTMEWDTAAGHAVLVAAGGSVVAADGEALRYGKPGFRNSWFIASGGIEVQPVELAEARP